MTDRYNAFTVVLEHDIRDDDAEDIINAIKHIRGVLSVKPHIAAMADTIAEDRVRADLTKKLWDVLYGKEDKS